MENLHLALLVLAGQQYALKLTNKPCIMLRGALGALERP